MKELTDFEVKALKLDGRKERLVTASPGLLVLLREGKKGITKTWMVEYPRGGKKVTESLGFYESPKPGVPLLTLKEVDVTRFNRHLLRSKLNWSDSHDESEIPSRIDGKLVRSREHLSSK